MGIEVGNGVEGDRVSQARVNLFAAYERNGDLISDCR